MSSDLGEEEMCARAEEVSALIALEAEIARLTAERDAANKIAEERRAELIREGNEKSEVWVELSSERVACEKAERERDRLINHLLKIGEYNSCPNGKSPSDCKHDCYTCWLAWAREGE